MYDMYTYACRFVCTDSGGMIISKKNSHLEADLGDLRVAPVEDVRVVHQDLHHLASALSSGDNLATRRAAGQTRRQAFRRFFAAPWRYQVSVVRQRRGYHAAGIRHPRATVVYGCIHHWPQNAPTGSSPTRPSTESTTYRRMVVL